MSSGIPHLQGDLLHFNLNNNIIENHRLITRMSNGEVDIEEMDEEQELEFKYKPELKVL
ncbi:MAG: hypothetical protein ACJ71G_00955 [Nitrososphaeraceae archaeon]